MNLVVHHIIKMKMMQLNSQIILYQVVMIHNIESKIK